MRVVEYVRKEVVVHVSNQLRRREIVGGVQAEPDSTSYSSVELCHRAKYRSNCLNRGRDMAIFRFYKMAAAAILDF